MGREMPVTETVKAQLEKEKQKKVLDEIVANNPVEVAEDFTVPQPSKEELAANAAADAATANAAGNAAQGMQPPPPNPRRTAKHSQNRNPKRNSLMDM